MTKSSNKAQAARLCSAATGVSYVECQRWFEQGLITRRRPVPEASTPDQQRLEAIAACELAEALSDGQLDGALLGIQKAGLTSQGFLRLEPHPLMAYAVVHILLPYHDHNFGGLRGVPGLRPRGLTDGTLVLADFRSAAGLVLRVPSGFDLRPASSDHGDYDPIWQDYPDSAHKSEVNYLNSWSRFFDTAGAQRRDRVLSRVLRRPAVLRRIGSTHGLAHTRSHWPRDLVIGWCCEASKPEVKFHLRRSGFTDDVNGVRVDDRESESRIWWGDTGLDLRHFSTCGYDREWASGIAAGYRVDEVLGRYPSLHRDTPNLRKLGPAHLYLLVQALFTVMGRGSVALSPADSSVDFILTSKSPQRKTCAISVKHATRALDAEAVRSFAGVITQRRFDEGFLVTTGPFTASAREFAGRHERIQLMDGAGLVRALEEHLGIRLDTVGLFPEPLRR